MRFLSIVLFLYTLPSSGVELELPKSLSQLEVELSLARPHSISYYPPTGTTPEIQRQLRLVRNNWYQRASAVDDDHDAISRVASEVIRLSIVFEWTDINSAKQGFRDWVAFLSVVHETNNWRNVSILLEALSTFVQRWAPEKPVESLAFVRETKGLPLFTVLKDEVRESAWHLDAQLSLLSYHLARGSGSGSSQEIETLLQERATAARQSSNVDLQCGAARAFYANGFAEAALAYLDGIENTVSEHEAIAILCLRFNIRLFGLGDRENASRLLKASYGVVNGVSKLSTFDRSQIDNMYAEYYRTMWLGRLDLKAMSPNNNTSKVK